MWGNKRVLILILALTLTASVVVSIGMLKYDTAAALTEGAERLRLRGLTAGYSIKETDNFLIRFPAEDVGIVRRVENQAERQLNLAADYFNYKPEGKIHLTIYPDSGHLKRGLRLPGEGTTLGAYYAGTINILSPRVWGQEGDAAEGGLYIHEITHLIMADLAGGNYPLWFTEGMALYQEYVNTGFEWGNEYIFPRLPYSPKDITDNFARLNQYIAYKQCFVLVKTLFALEGKERVLSLFEPLKGNMPFDEAFCLTFGYPPGDLYEFADVILTNEICKGWGTLAY